MAETANPMGGNQALAAVVNENASALQTTIDSINQLTNAHLMLVSHLPSLIELQKQVVQLPTPKPVGLLAFCYWPLKRSMDFLGSAGTLFLLAPFYLLIAAAIKLTSSGPVLFTQTRIGRNFQPFKIYKFRTMYMGSLDRPISIFDVKTNSFRRPTADEDPRVTPVGKFLRRWSLDELPQFYNIFKGDISLIGPRPLTVDESRATPHNALVRYKVPLGLSGLAQINNRSAMINTSRFDDDVSYIQNLSLSADLEIIFKTFSRIKQ